MTRHDTEHRLVAYNAILAGTFYKAVIAQDVRRAVDLLLSRDDVLPDAIGVAISPPYERTKSGGSTSE